VFFALSALVACGSTIQDRASLSSRQGNLPVDEFGNPIPGATAGTGAFVPGQPGSAFGGGTTGGFNPNLPTASPDRNGPGITSKSISIGIAYCDDEGALERSMGFDAAPSDERRAWEIVIEDTNKRGGIGGRSVEPVWKELPCSSSNDTFSSMYEEACAEFTQDHKVFAVMSGQDDVPGYVACVLRAGAVIIDTNLTDSDKQFLGGYPYNVQPASLAVDTMARVEVAALKAQNYFTPVDTAFPLLKVGILVDDTPNFERTLNSALLPALRQAGISVTNDHIVHIKHLDRQSDIGALSAGISAAVLRFNADHVSHVLFLQARGTLTLFFLREAQSQEYYPRYGFNSQDAAEYVLDFSGGDVVSPRNYLNALGIGWYPLIDQVRPPISAGPPERIACAELLKKHGYDAFGDANAEAIAMNVCDGMSFLKLSVGRAGSVVNQATFLAAVNGIGRSWRSTGSLGSSLLMPSKHDGANLYRYLIFDESDGHFRYSGPNREFGR
jgi:hypothetical protein